VDGAGNEVGPLPEVRAHAPMSKDDDRQRAGEEGRAGAMGYA